MADEQKILEYGKRQGRFIDALKVHPAYQGWSEDEIVKNVNDVVTSGKPDRVAKFVQGVASLPQYEGWQPTEVLKNVSDIFTKPANTGLPNKEKVAEAVKAAPPKSQTLPEFVGPQEESLLPALSRRFITDPLNDLGKLIAEHTRNDTTASPESVSVPTPKTYGDTTNKTEIPTPRTIQPESKFVGFGNVKLSKPMANAIMPFLEELKTRVKDLGYSYEPVVVQGVRNAADQLIALKRGHSQTPISLHQYGDAADIAFKDAHGRVFYGVPNEVWDAVKKSAQEHNLFWGGNWKTFIDKPHIGLYDRLSDSFADHPNRVRDALPYLDFFRERYRTDKDPKLGKLIDTLEHAKERGASTPDKESFPSFAFRKLIQEPASQVERGIDKIQGLGNTSPETLPSDLMRAATGAVEVMGSPFAVLNPPIEAAGQAIETLPGGSYLNPLRHLENIAKLAGMGAEKLAQSLGADPAMIEASKGLGESLGGIAPFLAFGAGMGSVKSLRASAMELAQKEIARSVPEGPASTDVATSLHPDLSIIPPSAKKDLIQKLGGEDVATQYGKVGELSDADLTRLAKDKGLFETAKPDEAPVSKGGDLDVVGENNKAQIEKYRAEGSLPPKTVEDALVEDPLHTHPPEVKAAIQEKANDLQAEALGWDVTKMEGGGIKEYEGGRGNTVGAFAGNAWSNFPSWFNELGASKKRVIDALEKIKQDEGKDKGVLVEKLKDIILKEGSKGGERKEGFIPPDENFAGLIDAYRGGKLDEYLSQTEFPTSALEQPTVSVNVNPTDVKRSVKVMMAPDTEVTVEHLEDYKGRQIIRSANGLIGVYDPKEEVYFVPSLDDSKMNGPRRIDEKYNTVEVARDYIDSYLQMKEGRLSAQDAVAPAPDKPAVSAEAAKPGEQGTLLTEQAKYPRPNEGIRSEQNIGTEGSPLFEATKPPEPELPIAETVEGMKTKLTSIGVNDYAADQGARLLQHATTPEQRRSVIENIAAMDYKAKRPKEYERALEEVKATTGSHKAGSIEAVRMMADEIERNLDPKPTSTMGAASRLELRNPSGSFAEALPADQFPDQGAIRGAVEQAPESEIQKQRRGERSHEMTIEAAKRQGVILSKALDGTLKPGTYSIAEAQYALGAEMAKRFAGRTTDTMTPEDVNLIKTWAGFRAEAGRAVESFKIPVDPLVAEFIKRVDPKIKVPIDVPPSTMEKIVELARNMKLIFSAAARGTVGNTVMQVMKYPTLLGEITVKNFMDVISGRSVSRTYREAVADAVGFTSGIKDGLKTAWDLLKEDNAAVRENAFYQQDIQRQGAISGRKGVWIRFPQRLHGAIDAAFRVPTAKGLIGREAMRQAFREGKKGNGLIDRANELMASPSPEMVMLASTDARYFTFQQDVTEWANYVNAVRFRYPQAQLILPFFNTPVNLANNMLDHTPVGLIKPSFVRALNETLRGDYNSNADIAAQKLSRVLIGTQFVVFTGNVIFHAMGGKITGRGPVSQQERDQLERATGWKPYSIRIGDKWVSYVGFEPASGFLSMIADFNEGYKDESLYRAVYNTSINLIKNFAQNPFLTSMKEVIDAMENPEGTGPEKFATGLAVGSVVPVFVQQSRYIMDPTLRKPQGFEEIFKSKIPGLTTDIPPQRNVMGQEKRVENPGLGLIGMRVSSVKNDADEIETQRLGLVLGWPSDMYTGIKLTPDQHDKLIEAAGKSFYLARHALMASQAYKSLTDGLKVDAIKGIQDKIRDLQRQTLFEHERLEGLLKKIEPRITGGPVPTDETQATMRALRRTFNIPEKQ